AVLTAQATPEKTPLTGEALFRQRCASCHGAKGEGTKLYSKPLAGDKSVSQLAAFIARSMPPPPRKHVSPQEAQRVAAHLYDAFYSPLAQARNRPPRVELSRLTVRQYRNAIADLIGAFRSPMKNVAPAGLRSQYFKTGRFRND